ncbi:hypothetical protein ABZ835_43415 [Streptomyces sp. NPDC047461]|uniref:hypothetical protein n=1 Tax=Streptomyces sp. NPDC047461 TaxID=3155619 RepID=UPI0033DDE147
MFVLLLVLILILFSSGFLNPLWWWAAAVLVFGATRHRRDRQDRWDRRYSLRYLARWRREDRRVHERRG